MLKKILLSVLVVGLLGTLGLFFWARSVLTQDTVRVSVAERLAQAIGQPVAIGGIGATVYPRVTLKLDNVAVGRGGSIRINGLNIGTDFRALLSRRIEHGSMRLTGARIQLPLPDFTTAAASTPPPPGSTPGAAPVEIASIDEIILSDVEIVSGGRTLRGDIEVVPQGNGVLIRKVALSADNATINITGQIADLSGPTGELTVKTGALDFAQLLAFASDFSKGAATKGSAPPPTPSPASVSSPTSHSRMNIAVTLDAERATTGTLALEKLSGHAKITAADVMLEPIAFGVFGGRYEGSLSLTLGATPDFRLKAALSGVDMAAATTFAGSPNAITGRLSGNLDLRGSGMDATRVANSAKGTLRFDITDGVVKNLGLIQAVMLATSLRAGAFARGAGSKDEAFTRLGGTMTIANGEGTTSDMRFESKDLTLGVIGTVRLDGSAINLKGRAQLSEALSQQAGADLFRYTQEQGRVTLPTTVGGSADKLDVRIDTADVAKRAVRNRANEEAQKQIGKGLGKLFGR